MAPLQIEGDTLGMKQKTFNILMEKEVKEGAANTQKINPDASDVDNLFAIEIACKTKHLEVILDVLKSEDMLYVSRVIKHSTWLVTDPQYAHIINPEYLHAQLFPHMTVKACNKLLLHIRLNLKDEARVDKFYHYFKNKDQKSALKWLPHCSLDVMKKVVEEKYDDIELDLLKRLCENSNTITMLETYVQKCTSGLYYKQKAMKRMMFLIQDHTEKYLDLVENDDYYNYNDDRPSFGPKTTSIIMKKCPQRIIDNFEIYGENIDLQTFAKHMKSEDIKSFLLKLKENDKMKDWFEYKNLKHFCRFIPKVERFNFFKTMFKEKSHMKDKADDSALCCESDEVTDSDTPKSYGNIRMYELYKYAPFEIAFPYLKKLIRSESFHSERSNILTTLVSCAIQNQDHVKELLQYFNDKHINESFTFKRQFVNMVITSTKTWQYDEEAWNLLNKIFHSMDIYSEGENNVKIFIECIIVKKVLHSEIVPDIIEKQFSFNTMKSVRTKLNQTEKEKIFGYLKNILLVKIGQVSVQNQAHFTEVLELLERLLTLIIDFDKDLADFPDIVAKIKELAHLKAKNSWKADMDCLYNKMKSWRRYIFEESLVMCAGEGAFLNALKHEPELMRRHAGAVAALRRDDAVSLRRVLAKLRVYWHGSLAAEWAGEYLAQLEGQGGHKAIVRGLCTLLPLKQLLDIIKKYEPVDNKINWTEDDEILLSLRKQIAKNMHSARPAPPLDAVLPYARGDYLQFALPSLNSILHNISPAKCSEHIPKLLVAPISLQKHGIKLALTKLESAELQKIFSDVWKSTKNPSIRAVLFKQTYQLLCNQQDSKRIEDIWNVMDTFIENLSQDENRTTYNLLTQVEKVPLQVRAKYCIKAYAYLNSLSPKPNCESFIKNVINTINFSWDLLESMEPNFVINVLQESPENKLAGENYFEYLSVMAAFLLCSKDAKSQIERFEKLIAPFLDSCLSQWETRAEGKYVIKNNVTSLVKHLSRHIPHFVFERQMVFPVQLFASIQEKLEAKLPMEMNYVFLKTLKITVDFVKILEEHKTLLSTGQTQSTCHQTCGADTDKRWDAFYLKVTPAFAAYVIKHLKEEMNRQPFRTLCHLLGKALAGMRLNMELNEYILLEILKNILINENIFIECYFLVITALPLYLRYHAHEEERETFKTIHRIFRAHSSTEVKLLYFSKFHMIDDFDVYQGGILEL